MEKKERLKGTYCLIIHLNRNQEMKIGKLGKIDFQEGYYLYVGSALNSLRSRIKRHLRDDKKIFWHVDYLLASENSEIREVVFVESPWKWECTIAQEISRAAPDIKGFGCSDCRCASHLFYFECLKDQTDGECLKNIKKYCYRSFENFELNPRDLKELD